MSWFLFILLFVTGPLAIAAIVIFWFARFLMRDAQELPDDQLSDDVPRSRYDIFNPFSWFNRRKHRRLFYQRDERGRYRKVRRH